jgi:hypothetical protein
VSDDRLLHRLAEVAADAECHRGDRRQPGAGTVLVAFTLNKPSFTEASATITMTGAPKFAPASANGSAANARIKNGAGVVIVSGLTVGTSGADINLNNTDIAAGQTVTLSSFSITHAP